MGDAQLQSIRATGVNPALVLHPAWAVAARQRLSAARERSRTGAAYTAHWGSHAAFEVPLRYVAGDARALLHRWWRDGERLLFTLDSSAGAAHAVVRIANATTPLARHEPPLHDRWGGLLRLDALDRRLRLGRPFILGHATDGRLDQPHLSLP